MHNKTVIGRFSHNSDNYQGLSLCYPPQPSASADNSNFGLDNYRCHAQPHPIIVKWNPLDVPRRRTPWIDELPKTCIILSSFSLTEDSKLLQSTRKHLQDEYAKLKEKE